MTLDVGVVCQRFISSPRKWRPPWRSAQESPPPAKVPSQAPSRGQFRTETGITTIVFGIFFIRVFVQSTGFCRTFRKKSMAGFFFGRVFGKLRFWLCRNLEFWKIEKRKERVKRRMNVYLAIICYRLSVQTPKRPEVVQVTVPPDLEGQLVILRE